MWIKVKSFSRTYKIKVRVVPKDTTEYYAAVQADEDSWSNYNE